MTDRFAPGDARNDPASAIEQNQGRNVLHRIRAWYARSRGMTKLALLLIGGLYAASFFMPVITTNAIYTWNGITGIYTKTDCGWEVFWAMITSAVYVAGHRDRPNYYPPTTILLYGLVGLANPIVWLGFVGIVKEKGGLVTAAGLVALLFGLLACFDIEKMKFVFSYEFGYYAWLLSMFAMAFFGVWLMLVEPRKQ
jgi:hypothetical protein